MFTWLKKSINKNYEKNPTMNTVMYGGLRSPSFTAKSYEALAKEGYQKNVIVFRCINLIAKSVSSVAWKVLENGSFQDEHPLLNLLNKPNPFYSGTYFIESLVSYYLLSGNGYIHTLLDEERIPVEIFTLKPDLVRVEIENGELTYKYNQNSTQKVLNNDEQVLIHIKNFNPLNSIYGMSPIEVAASSIDQHNAVGGHNLAILQNGGRPSGALIWKSEGRSLSDDQRDHLRREVREAYQGAGNSGKILIMEGDFEWKEMGLSPKDLDFLEGKHISSREIAQAFGVPPMLVGVPGDSTYANYKEARFHLWEETIIPLLETIKDAINQNLSPLYGSQVKLVYDLDSISALLPKREMLWKRIQESDFLTLNEKRKILGFSEIENGHILNEKHLLS